MSKCLSSLRKMAGFAVLLLAGCASVPADLGRGDVDALVIARGTAIDRASDELLSSLTAAPLSPDSAVRIALINNPRLQATYAMLGFGAADVYEAGRIRNPVFMGAFLNSNATGGGDQVTVGLVVSFTDLITLGARKRLSLGAFAALQQSVGAEVLAVAADAETAYYEYVGAQQIAVLRAQIAKAGALSAALAERFRNAGNMTPRELALERAAASEARLDALQTDEFAFSARTELAAVLSLSVADSWSAPAALHLPLETEDDLNTLLAISDDARLDLASARTQVAVLADRLGVVNWTRWLGELDAGIERERETDGSRLTGPTIDWEVPIFNQHKDAMLRANAELQIAINDVQRIATDVDNGVRLAHAQLESARARIEEYREVLIPQRIETVARAQEELNYMLIGIFELLALKQDEYDAYQGYLETIRDYWLARVNLSLATGSALPSSARKGDQRIDVEEFVRPADGGMDHSRMMHNDSKPNNSMDHSGHKMQPKKTGEPDKAEHDKHDNHGGSQ